jgi:GGDEF domain-containing protein
VAESFAAGAAPAPAPSIEDATAFGSRPVAPWTAAIERRLVRHREDGLPFAVLCVELVDLDRLVAADREGDVSQALEAAEAAMCEQLRPADALVRERQGRYWLTTPDTGPEEASVLAHRIVAGVAAASHRGEPLQAAVGVSTCPADSSDAGELEAHAEENLFTARASGIRVS